MSQQDAQNYLVLARKYRPRNFSDLYGQDALVQTLTNAIESERLHHAYVLSGIRGVGKTTTARILAKVLNCENGPSITWKDDDANCLAIEKGMHVDVLEFDAASHTGVNDIRELFEGVNYAPVQGRFKVYIIDEVHMLSKQAFNALLKTLEEPPEHVKFIFATTEVNKIPATVLSRCQRFDLKRITAETLYRLFTSILEKENVTFDESAVRMITKAADGSARDGLSLLDQAIALASANKVDIDVVTNMLGLADRTQMFELFDDIMQGDIATTIKRYGDMYAKGQDPLLVVSELAQIAHLVTRLKVVEGLKNSADLSELEKTKGCEFSEKLKVDNLSRVYQMLLHTAEEVKKADRPHEALEMALIRMTHLSALPPIEELMKAVTSGQGGSPQVKESSDVSPQKSQQAPPANVDLPPWEVDSPKPSAPASVSVAETDWSNWQDVVKRIRESSEALAEMIAEQVRPDSVSKGKLSIQISAGLHGEGEIVKKLSEALEKASGEKWQVRVCHEAGGETLNEQKGREQQEAIAKAKEHPDVKKILESFPGASIAKVEPENT